MEQDKQVVPQINVRQVLRNKNPKVASILPGFVYRYIKRIIHQDYLNEFLRKHGMKKDLEFIGAVIEDFKATMMIKGAENLPAEGRFIFAGNHPLGGFDGMLLIHYLSGKYPLIKALANDILMNISNLSGIFVPINKHGAHSKDAARLLDETFRSQAQIVTFPAGLVSRKIHGRIVDLEWKKNFISKALEYQRDVIPVHFTGRNTNWFYFVAKFRKLLKLKWNLEMFYLPDETYRHRNKTITITFGRPIPWQTFNNTKSHREWDFWVKQQVYLLAAVQLDDELAQ
jgi:putative hemolysin